MASSDAEATKNGIFLTVLIVSFVDQLGRDFLASVSISYGLVLKEDEFLIALSNGVMGFTLIFASIWMSMLADRVGERLVICISLFGSMTAYACQAGGWEFRGQGDIGFWLFFAGKGLEGFFGGTNAALMSLMARWFLEPEDLKRKTAILMAFGSLVGMFLAPIAGLLTTIAMPMPFRVATVMCLLGLAFALFALPRGGPAARRRRVCLPTPRLVDDPEGQGQKVEEKEEVREPNKNVWCDKVVLLSMVANFGFGIVIVGMGFLETLLILRNPSFGVVDPNDTPLEQKTAVAQMVTLIVMPLGLCALLVTVIVYPKLSVAWGDAMSILVFGTICCGALVLEGLSTQLWQVFAASGLQGIGLGVLLPALGPLLAIYASSVYPNQVSQTIALPNVGLAIGVTIGSNIVHSVDVFFESPTIDGERAGFIFVSIVGMLSSAGMSLVGRRVAIAIAVEEKRSLSIQMVTINQDIAGD